MYGGAPLGPLHIADKAQGAEQITTCTEIQALQQRNASFVQLALVFSAPVAA